MKFRYRAKHGPHDQQDGEIEAANERLAVNEILRQGLTPIEVYPTGEQDQPPHGSRHGRLPEGIVSFQQKFFQTDLVLFTRYLADFLGASVPALRSLQLIQQYFPSGRMSAALKKIEEALQEGDSLSLAMQRAPDVFSDMYVNMIRAGEMGGSSVETVERLADFLEQDRENRLRVFSSMIYPALIVLVGFMTLFVLFTWILPNIMGIFEEIDQKIPMITRMLMGVSWFFSKFWWALGLFCALMVMFFGRWYHTDEGRQKIDRQLCLFPWVGQFIRQVAVERFTRTLGTLIKGGVDIVPALAYASNVVENRYIRQKLQGLAEYVSGGMSLNHAVSRIDIFSETDSSMLAVGEETGDLPTGLFKLASFYEKNNERMIKIVTMMIEPSLILGLGLVIGFVVLAMLMPIFEMNLVVR